uniref:hypothetical protein n=1 Tax=uncultured Allobacillus sp. TaxID=1638025 RepID=UPI0025992831|nr:hypothetical protein [uncultured Allobacillus sp.]
MSNSNYVDYEDLKESSKHKSEYIRELQKENQRYRKLLTTFSDTSKIASKIMKEYPDIGMIGPNELIQWVTKNAEKALDGETNDDYEVSKC